MRKCIIGLLIIACLFHACNNNEKVSNQEFLIKGKLTNTKSETIYLEEITVDENVLIDSVIIDDNGEFKFKHKLSSPSFFMIKTAEDNFVTLLMAGGEQATLNGDIRNLAETYTVFDSPGSEQILKINQHTRYNYSNLDSLALFWDKNKYSQRKTAIRDSLDSIATEIIVDQQHFLLEFIEQNTSSMSCLIAIYQVFARKPMFDEFTHFDLFKELRDSLNLKYSGNEHVISFTERVDEVELEIKEKQKIEAKLDSGQFAPQIVIPGLWQNEIKLSDYKGHVVLLYFWASWDALSRQHNNTIKWLAKTYAPKGLVVFAVSLDNDKELWKNAVELDKLNWVHGNDMLYWESPVIKTYNVEKIPHLVLIDREGKIIARNFDIDELQGLLYKAFY